MSDFEGKDMDFSGAVDRRSSLPHNGRCLAQACWGEAAFRC